MSPHGMVLLSALLLAGAGKLMLPRSTLRVVAAAALAVPLALSAYYGEPPSLLGLLIVAPISLLGAAVGVASGGILIRFRRKSPGSS